MTIQAGFNQATFARQAARLRPLLYQCVIHFFFQFFFDFVDDFSTNSWNNKT